MYFKVYNYEYGEMVIEAASREVAAAVHAYLTGDHPDTITCSCCGPHGSCYHITYEHALQLLDEDIRFVFDNEYTTEQVLIGTNYNYYYDARNWGY